MQTNQYTFLLKEKSYIKLVLSNVINRFGDAIDAIAFTWLAYSISKSAAWASLIYGLNVLPNIFLQPLFGPLVEKMNKKNVIVITHFIRGFLILLFSFLYIKNLINPYIMGVFTLIISSVESFNLPASSSIIPQILPNEKLVNGLSLSTVLSSMATLAGTGLAGFIIAKVGIQFAMYIDICSFFVAGAIVLSMNITCNKNDSQENKDTYIDMLKSGISYLTNNHILFHYCILAVGINFLLVPVNALQGPIVKEVYGMDSALLSVIGVSESIGSIIGSAFVPKIMKKFSIGQSIFCFGILLGISIFVSWKFSPWYDYSKLPSSRK